MPDFDGRVGFAVGTGRSGTKFLARILSLEPGVSAVHERNPNNETFHRYCKWNKLPVDHAGFLHVKEKEIMDDFMDHQYSFESSAPLSFSIEELYSRFRAKFVMLVRSPERVVNSYFRKGLYHHEIIREDPNLVLGYQDIDQIHHFLGRIVPTGEEYLRWEKLSVIGKIAWWWQTVNSNILDQFGNIPDTHWRIEKLEDLSFARYKELALFLGIDPKVDQTTYENIAQSRPNYLPDVPTVSGWSSLEIEEFQDQVAPIAKKLGYEYHVALLPKLPNQRKGKQSKSFKLKKKLFSTINKLAGSFQNWSRKKIDQLNR